MDELHEAADQPLDDPAVVRSGHRPMVELDPMLQAAALQRLAAEFGCVIDM